jgi:hypothetical protein
MMFLLFHWDLQIEVQISKQVNLAALGNSLKILNRVLTFL